MKNVFFSKWVPVTLTLLITVVLFTTSIYAQDPHAYDEMKADFDVEKNVISLDKVKYLGNTYFLDLEEMNFNSIDEADVYFASLNTELVTFKMDSNNNRVQLTLHMRSQPRWELEDWSNYLSTLKKW